MAVSNNGERILQDFLRRSRSSLYMTVLFVTAVIVVVAYLSQRAVHLQGTIQNQQEVIEKNNIKISSFEDQLSDMEESISLNKKAAHHFEFGIRSLLNRDFVEAIRSFERFLVIRPGDSAALNYLAYSKYRLWLSSDGNSADLGSLIQSAESNYVEAIKADRGESLWPLYNLTLLRFQTGKRYEALDNFRLLISEHHESVRYVCEDGQFRRFRRDKVLGEEFAGVLSAAAVSQGMNNCWVVSGKRSAVQTKGTAVINPP